MWRWACSASLFIGATASELRSADIAGNPHGGVGKRPIEPCSSSGEQNESNASKGSSRTSALSIARDPLVKSLKPLQPTREDIAARIDRCKSLGLKIGKVAKPNEPGTRLERAMAGLNNWTARCVALRQICCEPFRLEPVCTSPFCSGARMPTSANCPKDTSNVRADVGIRAPILPPSQQPLTSWGLVRILSVLVISDSSQTCASSARFCRLVETRTTLNLLNAQRY